MHTILFCFVLLLLHNRLQALHINDLLILVRISSLTLRASNNHYSDVIMATMASQITSLTIVHTTVYSGADQSKHQSSASLAFVWWIHRWPVNSPHKWPVTRKRMFPFDDVIMWLPNETNFCHISQYLTITKRLLSHIPQYTIQNRNVYISVLNCVLWDMGQVHCGICETALFLERTTWTYPGTDVVLLLVSAWILVRFPLLFTFIPQESRLPSYDWDF